MLSQQYLLSLSLLLLVVAIHVHVASGFIHPQGNSQYPTRSATIALSAAAFPSDHLAALSYDDEVLAVWVLAFAFSHIGMSATRSSIIATLGNIVASPPLNLVGREEWTLPEWWPADSSGGDKLFPDADTAGRQLYRAGYTAISFATLGSAFAAYLRSSSSSAIAVGEAQALIGDNASFLYNACLATAALSFGASIASLFNASPLGLMPGFESVSAADTSAVATHGDTSTLGVIRRDDNKKFTARGLTRITRHPLILPVVPWGIATAYLAGNRLCDFIMFAGLSLYAIAGCAAQDLRVSKEEGSVGTVFRPNESVEEGQRLSQFFQQTSFLPFGAVLDGRQDIGDIFREVPWLGFVVGTATGVLAEEKILYLLSELSV